MPPNEPNAGRREYDSGGAMVVPLREYLEDKIQASHNELALEIRETRASVTEANAQGTRQHVEVRAELTTVRTEVRTELSGMRTAVEQLERQVSIADNTHRVSLKTLSIVAAAVSGFLIVLTGIVALILQAVLG